MNPLTTIREAVVKKSVNLFVQVYNDLLLLDNVVGNIVTEDVRRNQIVDMITKNKEKYSFDYIISTESGTYDKEFKTNGRIDICVYYIPQKYTQEYLSFECKRFCKDNSTPRAIKKAYYDEGINRYETGKYKCDTGVGGMIAFCEEGDFVQLKNKICTVLANHTESLNDVSALYNHNYIYSSKIKCNGIRIISIIMNFVQ